jgi:oligoendopeptidase F
LGRFDYSVEDVLKFHEAIQLEVLPLVKSFDEKRIKDLQLAQLKPWDMDVDTSGKPGLHPFENGAQLLEQTKKCFSGIDPYFLDVILTMESKGHFDLDSRIGKAPGGYNYPLPVSGLPFIFMNAAGAVRDVETMVHEAGHAFHSVLTNTLELNGQKNFPSEVAELASMSMELITHDQWDAYFPKHEDAVRAKEEHLEGIIRILPWIATVDAFQHWIYTNPTHTRSERRAKWLEITSRFSTGMVHWEGMEHIKSCGWHKQLHIFEVPFYYIEYGIAQLGAIGVWRNVKLNKQKGLEQYKKALSLGYSATMPEIYEAAGVNFDFTAPYLKSLMQFVQTALHENK